MTDSRPGLSASARAGPACHPTERGEGTQRPSGLWPGWAGWSWSWALARNGKRRKESGPALLLGPSRGDNRGRPVWAYKPKRRRRRG